MAGFIFGGDTGQTADDLARRRKVIDALRANSVARMPRDVGEGIYSLGTALVGRYKDKKLDPLEDQERARISNQFDAITNGIMGGGQPSYTPAPVSTAPLDAPAQIGADTMAAIGRPGNAPTVDGSALGVDFGALEHQYGLPSGYLGRTAHIESGGNPNAQNPKSSAGGPFQFIDSTASQYGLTNRFDPSAASDAAARLARDNAALLRERLGRNPTAAELYLAHQQGGGGAAALLANPNARAVDIVGADAVRLNGGNADMTAGEFAGLWTNKFGANGGGTVQGGAPGGGQPRAQIVSQLAELMQNPYLSDTQKIIAQQLLGEQMQAPDPMAAIELERAQLELDALRNPQAKPQEPIEVGGVLLDPVTREVIFDSRTPEGGDPRYQPVGGQIWDMQPEGGGPPTLVGGGSEEVIYGPDGTPIVTRGPAGSARPFTEAQSKDVVFATRAQGALDVLDPVSGKLTERLDIAGGYVPFGLGKGLQDPDYQVARQAADEFLQAILRKDTGAAITEQEQALYGVTYLPQPGDGPEVLQAKADARRRAISAIEAGMSASQIIAQERALGGQAATPDAPTQPGQTLTYNPETGDFE